MMKHWISVAGALVVPCMMLTACSTSSDGGGSGSGGNKAGAGAGSSGAKAAGSGGTKAAGSGGTKAAGSGGTEAGGAGGMELPGGGAAGWQNIMDPKPAVLGTVARGQYLVDHVLLCGVCHTPSTPNGEPDPSKYLAGSRSYDFEDVDGTIITVNAENLTSHDPEGLHAWSDGQIRTAITKGVDDEHYAIYPIMPYPEYSMLTPEDVDSIIQYLRTVPPNPNVVASDFPYADVNPPAPSVDESKVPHTTLPKTDADYEAAERGRYLAKVACLNCHTEELKHDEKIAPDVPDLTKAFAGGKQYTFIRGAAKHTSLNITPDATGLAGWSVDDIVAAIKTNKEKGTGRTFCNTHPGGVDRFGMMTDADVKDLATYIHTLPPVKNGPFTCIKQ
jgi:mono/diheme cytochrome c family protein/predicted small secreted protein